LSCPTKTAVRIALCALAIALLLIVGLWWFGRDELDRDSLRPTAADSVATDLNPGRDPLEVESRSSLAPHAKIKGAPTPAKAILRCVLRGTFEPVGPDRMQCVGSGEVRWDPAEQAFRLSPGRWRLKSRVPELRVQQDEFPLRADERRLVWVGEITELPLLVTDEFHHPLEGATVRWVPLGRRSAIPHSRPDWSSESTRRTNAEGRCGLPVEAHRTGGLQVSHPGYRTLHETRAALPRDVPWVVRLEACRSSDPLTTILVRDESSGAPVSAPWLRTESSPGQWDGDEAGRLRVLTQQLDDEILTFGADGFHPRSLTLERIDNEHIVDLQRSTSVSVIVQTTADAEEVTLLVAPEVTESAHTGQTQVAFYESHVVRNGQPTMIEVPQNTAVELLAYDALGRSFGRRIVGRIAESRIVMRLEPTPEADLVIRGHTQAGATPETNATALLHSASPHVALRLHSHDGVLRVPFADRVTSILVHARGYAPTYLRPIDRSQGGRAGELGLPLITALDLEVRVVDSVGEPLIGYCLRVNDDRNRDAFRTRQELHGSWATDHPAWMASEPNFNAYQEQLTDQDGRVVLREVPGLPLELSAFPAPEESVEGYSYFMPRGGLRIDPATVSGVITLQLPRSRYFEIVVVDALTDLPLPTFQLNGQVGPDNLKRSFSGSYWAGRVPENARLSIVSAGYLERELDFSPDTPIQRRVPLTPAAAGRLVFSGIDLRAARLAYRIDRNTSTAGDADPGPPQLTSFIEFEDGFHARAAMPEDGRLLIQSIEIEGEAMTVTPKIIALPLPRAGPPIRVQVSRD